MVMAAMEASDACAKPRPGSDERVIVKEGAASSIRSTLRRCVSAGLLLLMSHAAGLMLPLSHAAGVLPLSHAAGLLLPPSHAAGVLPLKASTGTGEAWRRPASSSTVYERFDDDRRWVDVTLRLPTAAPVFPGVPEQRGMLPRYSPKRVIRMTGELVDAP